MGRAFGDGDASLEAMGGEPGVARLVECFYDLMASLAEVATVRAMHPPDLSLSREKLTAFLTAWLGGPRRYSARWGTIRIPHAHAHLSIGPAERDQWLLCMDQAIDAQGVTDAFATYFKAAIRVPADRIVSACEAEAEAKRSL